VRYPISYAQQLLCIFDTGEEGAGPFGPRHNITWSWRVRGQVDTAILAEALGDVVTRHEALRTRIIRDGDDLYQEVAPPSPAQVSEVDLSDVAPADRDRRSEELVIELEGGLYGIEPLPLLRAVLARFDEQDSVLVLIMHHAVVDGWSTQVIARDLAAAYARRRGHDVVEHTDPAQYREFAVWQRESGVAEKSLAYWREKLDGAHMATVTMDFPRSANLPKNTSVVRYALDEDVAAAVRTVARSNRSTPFIVLLAAYYVLLARRTGATDLVVPTIGANRKQARFNDAVGNFTNFLPLRTDLAGAATFQELIERARATFLEGYAKEIPFLELLGTAPALMARAVEDDQAMIAFQVLQLPFTMDGEVVGDLELHTVPRRLSQERATEIPDGALWQLDVSPSGGIGVYLGYNTHKFTEATVLAMAEEYTQVLKETVLDPQGPLRI
jgi:condensation enzyme